MTGRVCLLTGAGGVLGDAFCRAFADRYDIAAVYRSEAPLAPSQDRRLFDPLAPSTPVPDTGTPVFAIRADLGDEGAVERVVELTLARFGQVDLVVNAAADLDVAATTDPRLRVAWEQQLVLNTVVPVHLSAVLAQTFWGAHEIENRRGGRNVINVSSTSGSGGAPGTGRAFYGASKAALNVVTRQMAAEYRPLGVRVNAVAPTTFPERVPVARVLDAIWQLDEGASTGEVLVVE